MLPERLPEGVVEALKETIRRHLCEEIAPVVRDRQGRAVRISNIWQREPVFQEVLTCSEVLDPLESLMGPNIELILNRHNHATLRLGGDSGSYMHRDILQWT